MITRAGALARETINAVELELRRIEGVIFAGFADRDDALVAQLVVSSNYDLTQVRGIAERVCRAYVDRPVVIELAGGTRAARVRLLDVQSFDVGEGVMLVFDSPSAGERYGVASGDNVEQAAARATLHALNRYLAAQPLSA